MPQKTRDDLKDLFENLDKPDENDFGDLIDSVPNFQDDGDFGLNDHDPQKLYTVGQGVFDAVTRRIYRCKANTVVGVALSDTNYWEPSSAEIVLVNEPVEATSSFVKATTSAAGEYILVAFTQYTPHRLVLYKLNTAALAENIPYVVINSEGKRWVAAAGAYMRETNMVGGTAQSFIAALLGVNAFYISQRVETVSDGATYNVQSTDGYLFRGGVNGGVYNVSGMIPNQVLFVRNAAGVGNNLEIRTTSGVLRTIGPNKAVIVTCWDTGAGKAFNIFESV